MGRDPLWWLSRCLGPLFGGRMDPQIKGSRLNFACLVLTLLVCINDVLGIAKECSACSAVAVRWRLPQLWILHCLLQLVLHYRKVTSCHSA